MTIPRVNSDGATTAIVEIEQPRLRLTLLRLDDYTFHTLAPGTLPTGAEDLARWNAADLIAGYDRSLAALLARQFPPLHDPQDPAGQIALPRLARKPFRAQDQAIQAALKLLARRRNPFLVAEVGTGKSTMALVVAAALSPAHHPATLAELARTGPVIAGSRSRRGIQNTERQGMQPPRTDGEIGTSSSRSGFSTAEAWNPRSFSTSGWESGELARAT